MPLEVSQQLSAWMQAVSENRGHDVLLGTSSGSLAYTAWCQACVPAVLQMTTTMMTTMKWTNPS